jgi:hypothetical protein
MQRAVAPAAQPDKVLSNVVAGLRSLLDMMKLESPPIAARIARVIPALTVKLHEQHRVFDALARLRV